MILKLITFCKKTQCCWFVRTNFWYLSIACKKNPKFCQTIIRKMFWKLRQSVTKLFAYFISVAELIFNFIMVHRKKLWVLLILCYINPMKLWIQLFVAEKNTLGTLSINCKNHRFFCLPIYEGGRGKWISLVILQKNCGFC